MTSTNWTFTLYAKHYARSRGNKEVYNTITQKKKKICLGVSRSMQEKIDHDKQQLNADNCLDPEVVNKSNKQQVRPALGFEEQNK